jgi:hypothetical protein
MKSQTRKKLYLSIETLATLQSEELAGVAGGNAISVPPSRITDCPTRAGGKTCLLCIPDQH